VGLDFWATVVDAHGGDMSVIVQDFGNAPEYQERFGNLDNNTLVNNLYQQMFGRDAENGGLNFWVGLLASGSQTVGQVAHTIANLATEIDLQVLTGRVALADAFSSNLATNTEALAYFNTVAGLEISRDYLSQVKGATVDNISAYVANAAETVATLPPSTGGIPVPTPPAITLSADSGISLTDHITSINLQTISGTYTGEPGDGNQVQVKLDNGDWTNAIMDEDTNNWSLSEVMLTEGSGTLAVQTVNAVGDYITGTGYSYSYTLDTDRPTDVSFGYELVGKVSVTSNEAGNAGLYDADSALIAGTTTTKLVANVERTVAVTVLSVLTLATVKVKDVAGNFVDDSDKVSIGTNGTDLFSSDQYSSKASYGFGGDDTFEFESSAVVYSAKVYGGNGIDTIRFTAGFDALSEGANFNGDFESVTSVESVQLSGASLINIGGAVHAAGINKILTGNSHTAIRYDDSSLGQITVDGSALDTGKTLTLSKFASTADFVVINLHGNLDSTQLDDSIHVTAVSDSGVTIMTGSGNDIINAGNGSNSITGGEGIDTLSGGVGIDTFNFATGDAAAYVFSPLNSGSNISDGALFTFTSGTDVITNFTAGTDKLLIAGVTDVANQYGNNYSDAAIVSNGNANFVHGDYDTTAHTFTVSSGGNSTLVIFNSSNSQDAIVLTGVANLTVADFTSNSQVG
jgi:hypothetical protein